MALAMMTGKCWHQMLGKIPGYKPVSESKIILAGVRDIDRLEKLTLANSDVYLLSDMTSCEQDAILTRLTTGQENTKVHVPIDLDVYNPNEAPANTYQPSGGPSVK